MADWLDWLDKAFMILPHEHIRTAEGQRHGKVLVKNRAARAE